MTNLKRYRLMMGMKQKELASKLNITPQSVNTMELKGIYDTRIAVKYAAAFKCNPIFLLDGLTNTQHN